MNIFDFATDSPWWTLVYLMIICGSLRGFAAIAVNKAKNRLEERH